mmetsp:Transcript_80002/g.193778  ORF Transcript_80002/g.193778 Transcript_80002/m.193778 type:complete len:276 (+) Transcript_80002:95-922(+)
MRRPSIVHRLNGGRRSSPVACSHVCPGRHDPCRAVRLGARLQRLLRGRSFLCVLFPPLAQRALIVLHDLVGLRVELELDDAQREVRQDRPERDGERADPVGGVARHAREASVERLQVEDGEVGGAHHGEGEVEEGEAEEVEHVVPAVQRVVLDIDHAHLHEEGCRVHGHARRVKVDGRAIARVHVLGPERVDSEEEDKQALRRAHEGPPTEGAQREGLTELPLRVERGEEVGRPLRHVLVEGEREGGEDRDDRPARYVHGVEVRDAAEAGKDVEE